MFERTINPNVELRNTRLAIYHFRVRLAIVAGFALVMFTLLFARFFYLQVVMRAHYDTLAVDPEHIGVVKNALAVVVENAGFGAAVVAPIARQVIDYFLLGKAPKSLKGKGAGRD